MVRTRGARLFLLSLLLLVPMTSARAASDPLRGAQWTLDRIGAEPAWQRSTGDGVLVAVIDTGVQLDHEDLRRKVDPGIDLVMDDADPDDEHGHGTAVAGVIAAQTGNGVGISATAPRATLLPIRAFDGFTSVDPELVADGIRAAVAEADRRGLPLVVNLSLADLPGLSDLATPGGPVEDAVHEAHAEGAVVVFAAGVTAPSIAPRLRDVSLWVGATDRADRRTVGTLGAPDLMAPGTDVLTTAYDPIETDRYTCDEACTSGTLEGTSYAAGSVSGAAALLLALGHTNDETMQRLLTTADREARQPCTPQYGCGLLDVAEAVGSVTPAASAEPVPLTAERVREEDPRAEPQRESSAATQRRAPTSQQARTINPAEAPASPAPNDNPATHGSIPAPEPRADEARSRIATVLLAFGLVLLAWGVLRPTRRPAPETTPSPVRALDGVRGIAIAWVVALHAVLYLRGSGPQSRWLEPLLAGDLGVDLFFVLSGFLLFRSWQAVRSGRGLGRASVEYARRRALRILPVYWVSLVVLIPVTAPALIDEQRWGDLALFASVQQFLGGTLPWEVNGVTWSLTTEIHFYMVLPLAAALMVRAGPARTLVGLVAMSLAWRVWVETGARWPSDLLPGRIDQFAAGMAAAWVVATPAHQLGRLGQLLRSRHACAAMSALLACVVTVHGAVINRAPDLRVPWQMVAHPMIGLLLACVLVRVATAPRSRVLAAAPARALGHVSYSLYLWHLPFLAMTQWWEPGRTAGGLSLLIAAGLAASILSYALIERPLLRRKAKIHPFPARERVPARAA